MKNSKTIIFALIAVLCLAIFAGCEFADGGKWLYDETYHWQENSDGEIVNKAEHTFGEWTVITEATTTEEGEKSQQCSICGYTQTSKISVADPHDGHTLGDWQSDSDNHWRICSCGETMDKAAHTSSNWQTVTAATTTTDGEMQKICVVCGRVLSTEKVEKLTGETRSVDLYAINDFHGEVDKISTVGGYLKGIANKNANTVLLNSGDMFQGSMESNSNYGTLLTNCMDVIGFDAFSFGNHEFDWGLEKLQNLVDQSATPFLGANIYHWDANTRTWGTFASELAREFVVKTLPNGLKIGVIGVIGKDQITSISSNFVQTIGFKDPAEIIPSLSQKLRNEEGCDIVVVDAHTGPETFLNDGSFDITQYADAVFCAHTHLKEEYMKNGVPFIQGGCYGSNVSHVSLSVDANGNVTCDTYENISYNYSWDNLYTLETLVDNSNAKIATEANAVLATLNDGYLGKYEGVSRLVCHAIATYVEENYSDEGVVLAMANQGRASLQSGSITYSELYGAIPFDNLVYIAKVSGRDLLKEARYNYIWRMSGEAIENSNTKYYKIAVLDYLLFHQNSNRIYDYFPSAFNNDFTPYALENDNYEMYNYRYITRDFLLQNNVVSASDYIYDNSNTNVELLEQSVSLASDANALASEIFANQACVLPENLSDGKNIARVLKRYQKKK